jgi:ribonuclease HI
MQGREDHLRDTHGVVKPKVHNLEVFCDGACFPNPGGVGGWGVYARRGEEVLVELSGHAPRATNNQMELTGAIQACLWLGLERQTAVIYCDSKYVIRGVTEWVHKWRRNGWRTMTGGSVLNRALWEELAKAAEIHAITWKWIKGHAGHHGNERADALASAARLAGGGLPPPKRGEWRERHAS